MVNINPDPYGDPWWVHVTSPITPEIQAVIDNIPLLVLSDTSLNTPLSSYIDNSEKIYMRSVFLQEDGCCAQASGIGYTFTYEINRLRNLSADTSDNKYPTHFSYNIVRNYPKKGSFYSSGWSLLKYAGCPNVTEYGGMYHYYPPQQIEWRDRVWESDFNIYKNALSNRVKDYYRIAATTVDGLTILKHWLNDHNEGDTVGGLACFSTFMGGETTWEKLDDSTSIAIALDDSLGYHAMTIVGYNDTLGWDFNGDSVISNLDNNGDTLNMNEWELGALKIVNSWGHTWPIGVESGYGYIPYRFLADTNYNGNPSKIQALMVVNAEDNNEERLLLKTTVVHESREKLTYSTGYANNANQLFPVEETEIGIFRKHGGNWPMQSRFENDTTALECGLDFGQFYINKDFGKIFLDIFEYDPSDTCTGRIIDFSIVDYRWDEEFELVCDSSNVPFASQAHNRLSINYDLIPHESPITTTDTLFSNMVSRFNPEVSNGATLLVEKGVSIDMYNSEITINAESTLTLEDSVTITAKSDTCRIIIDGEINIGKHINFIAEDSALLEIWINNDNLVSTFDSVYFERCKIFHYGKEVNIKNSEFVDCQRIYSGNGKVLIDKCELTKTGIHLLNPEESDFLSTISNCELNTENTGTLPGIRLQDCDRFNIFNNTISGYFTGIDLRFSGTDQYTDKKVTDNTIDSCSFNGISTYYSIVLIEVNNIQNNLRGISFFNNSTTEVIGDEGASSYEESQQISNNTSYELYSSLGSFPWSIQYNVIHDSDNGTTQDPIVYTEINPGQLIPDTFDIRYNCWDANFDSVTDLNPSYPFYKIRPKVCPGKKSTSAQSAEPLYRTGLDQFADEQYSNAKNTFHQVVEQFPGSAFSLAAMKSMFDVEQFVDNDYYILQDYYLTNTSIVSDSSMKTLGIFLANRCNLSTSQWQAAINHYENIIDNPPTPDDSIFAIIDLGYTYLLMQNSSGKYVAMGKMTQFIPDSELDFETESTNLLRLLPFVKSNNQENNDETINTAVKENRLLQSKPNPTNGITEISFNLNSQNHINISILNNMGSKLKTTEFAGKEGMNSIELNMSDLPSGIYYYTLEIDNRIVDIQKMIVVR